MNVHFNKDDYFPHQWDFLTSEKTINGLVAGFGSGKTHVFLRKTLYNLLTRRNRNNKSNGWVVYPTLSLADSTVAYNIMVGDLEFNVEDEDEEKYEDYFIAGWDMSCEHLSNLG